MKKDILLAVISEAIDKGAHISINMGQYNKPNFEPVTEQEAFTVAQMVSDAIGVDIEERDDTGSVKGVHSFSVSDPQEGIYFTSSYHKFMEEDVDLTGSDYEEGEQIA